MYIYIYHICIHICIYTYLCMQIYVIHADVGPIFTHPRPYTLNPRNINPSTSDMPTKPGTYLDPSTPRHHPLMIDAEPMALSHRMYQLNGFKKLTTPQNRKLIVYYYLKSTPAQNRQLIVHHDLLE